MKMPSRGVSSALVFAATCLLDTSKAFMVGTKTSTTSSSNSNGINNNSNKWTKKVDTSHKVPVGSNNSGFGASLLLPHVKGFGAESVVNLPRVPSAIDHAQRKSRGNSCPPLHFGLHDILTDFQEHGQCGGVTPTREGEMERVAVVVEEEKEEEMVEEEVMVVEEEVAVEVDEKEVVMDKKKRLLSWLRKKAKKSAAAAAAEGGVEEVGEKKGPVSWLRKKVFRRTETSAVADGAAAAAAPTAPAAPAHDVYLRIAVRMMSMDQRLALIAWGTTNT